MSAFILSNLNLYIHYVAPSFHNKTHTLWEIVRLITYKTYTYMYKNSNFTVG